MTDPTPPPLSENSVVLPEALAEAPRSHGLAVPYITLAHRDRSYRPVWGARDPFRLRQILDRGLCQICGTPLNGEVVVFIRPDDYELGVAGEPGLHPGCADYSKQACPMLAGRIHRYNPHPETRVTPCGDPRCQCAIWIRPASDKSGAGRPVEAWYAIRLPLAEYRVVTIAATDNNPEVTGIDLRTPSLMYRIGKVRAAADIDNSRIDLLAQLVFVSTLFGGEPR